MRELWGVMIVYVIQAEGTNKYKIGYTKHKTAAKRLRTLQTASHEKLSVINLIQGDKELERKLHDMFSDKRLCGEWFDLSREDLDKIDKEDKINGFFEKQRFFSRSLLHRGGAFIISVVVPLRFYEFHKRQIKRLAIGKPQLMLAEEKIETKRNILAEVCKFLDDKSKKFDYNDMSGILTPGFINNILETILVIPKFTCVKSYVFKLAVPVDICDEILDEDRWGFLWTIAQKCFNERLSRCVSNGYDVDRLELSPE